MGKNLRHKHVFSPVQNHPGFIWNLFNILKHNHWRYIKKRLPHKKPVGRRHFAGARNSGNNTKPSYNEDSQAHGNAEANNSTVDGKSKTPNSEEKSKKHSETKNSVKARIKALITDDKSKRKARHHRNSSYPVQSKSTDNESLHELESAAQNRSNDETSRISVPNVNTSPVFGSLNPLYLMSEESSSSDSEDNDTIKNNHVRGDVKKLQKKKKFLDDIEHKEKPVFFDTQSLHAKELADKDGASPRLSKPFLDALNLIDMNKDFLLKVLQDPGSPLARHFHSQQALSAKMVLTKARSFPASGSSGKEVYQSNMIKQQKEDGLESKLTHFDFVDDIDKNGSMASIAAEDGADGIQKLDESTAKISDDNFSGSGLHIRKRGRNQMVVKRFKDLRQKIRHAIEESKNEKHRIAMDAVLDKVPRKHGFSKDLRQEAFDLFKEPWASKSRKEGLKQKHTRTASLGGSLDRYLQLYECRFHKEDKNHGHEKSLLGTEATVLPSGRSLKSLGRILSLPEMKFYSYKTEDSPETLYPLKEIDEFEASSNLDEKEKFSEDQSLLDASVENNKQVQLVNTQRITYFATEDNEENSHREICDEFSQAQSDISLNREQDIDSEVESSDEPAEESSSLEPGFAFDKPLAESPTSQENSDPNVSHLLSDQVTFLNDPQETDMDTHEMHETETDQEKAELSSEQLDSEILQDVHVETKDRAKFDYVRDVLELSGFSSPDSITIWHSDYQPVDPSLYEEVTGCVFCDPECSGYYEGGNCRHLLLFDLINEVLMEIYEHCYHYCPMSLSSLCQINPMPVGYGVLKQVWVTISWYLRSRPNEDGQSLDYLISRDLSKPEGWMNLQFDSECVGIEVEDLIFDELLEELILD